MNVDVFTLCDYARAEGNKMTIVGAFNRILARQAPISYPHCAIAAIMRFDRIEEGQKAIRLSFIDADGRPVMPQLEHQLNVQFPATETEATVRLALLIAQIVLPNFGDYSVHLAVDGREEASIPLHVVRASPRPALPQPPAEPNP